jgi:hypothetical protein
MSGFLFEGMNFTVRHGQFTSKELLSWWELYAFTFGVHSSSESPDSIRKELTFAATN